MSRSQKIIKITKGAHGRIFSEIGTAAITFEDDTFGILLSEYEGQLEIYVSGDIVQLDAREVQNV
jgi:hypothetical protein